MQKLISFMEMMMKLNGSITIFQPANINGLTIQPPISLRLKNFLEKKCQAKIEVDTANHTISIYDAYFITKKIKAYNQLSQRFDQEPGLEKPYQQFEEKLIKLETKIDEFEQYGVKINHYQALKSLPAYGKSNIINLIVQKLKIVVEEFEAQVETHLNFKNKNLFQNLTNQIQEVIKPYKLALEEHRHPSKVFIYNLLIALTIIGAFLIAVKLLYTKITTGRSEYFFNETQSSKFSKEIMQLSQAIAQ